MLASLDFFTIFFLLQIVVHIGNEGASVACDKLFCTQHIMVVLRNTCECQHLLFKEKSERTLDLLSIPQSGGGKCQNF